MPLMVQVVVREKTENLRRLEAQRNELNAKVRLLREELSLLQEPGSYVGEVVKVMGRKKVSCGIFYDSPFCRSYNPSPQLTLVKLSPAFLEHLSARGKSLILKNPRGRIAAPPLPLPICIAPHCHKLAQGTQVARDTK